MTSTKHVNNFATTINGALTNVATSVTLTSITGLSVLTAGDKVRMTLVSASANEIILLTYAAATSTFTIARGQESTTAVAWATGTRIEARITANSVDSKMNGPATYTASKVIRGNGTTYVESTPTWPDTVSTSGKRLKSDGTNIVMSTTTMPDTGTTGKLLIGDGTNYVESTPSYPNAASTALKLIRSDGTNFITSTATFSDTPSTSGKRLRSDGTNWITSTTTMPDTGTSLKAIVGDGTNYVERTIIQSITAATGAVATGTTVVPNDDTIPQNTEGDQYLTVSITPTNSSHKLNITVVFCAALSTGLTMGAGLFQDSTADALCAGMFNVSASNTQVTHMFSYSMTAGTTSSTTFNVRIGPSAAATLTLNGAAAARKFGGVCCSRITVTEVIA